MSGTRSGRRSTGRQSARRAARASARRAHHDATERARDARGVVGVRDARALHRARCLAAVSDGDIDEAYDACPHLDEGDQLPNPSQAAFELGQYVQLMEIMADMAPMMDYGDPYNP